MKRAAIPFHFHERLALTLATGRRASSLGELLEGIRDLPESVIYQHTHAFLLRHQEAVPEPPHDLAVWASQALRDEPLSERLAGVDTVRFRTMADLRHALVAVLDDHLSRHGDRRAPEGHAFHFMRAVRFSLPTRYRAWTLQELGETLRVVSVQSLYLHVFEARLRPPHGVNDFSSWFKSELDERALAAQVAGLDPYLHTIEGLRAVILAKIRARIAEAGDG